MATRASQTPSVISLTDVPAILLPTMIGEVGYDTNKVEEVASRNTSNKNDSLMSKSGDPWRSSVKDIPLERRRRANKSCQRRDKPHKSCRVTTRMDNSLLVTTRKFLGLKTRSESVNLNDAAEILNVPKRRLYDITNVLEGIDIVEKIGKNSIRWKSNDGDAILLEKLRLDCENLLDKEIELDSTLLDLTSAVKLVREDPTYKPYGYLHLEDVHSLDMFSNQTLIAVKSSAETQSFIEVADPARTGKFQLKVGTANYSPLNVFLCPSYAHVFSSIEEVLSSGDLGDRAERSPYERRIPWISRMHSGTVSAEINESNRITNPFSNIVTPCDVASQDNSSYLSPLKILLEQHNNVPSHNDKELTNASFTPHGTELDSYNFPPSGLSLGDLFCGSD